MTNITEYVFLSVIASALQPAFVIKCSLFPNLQTCQDTSAAAAAIVYGDDDDDAFCSVA